MKEKRIIKIFDVLTENNTIKIPRDFCICQNEMISFMYIEDENTYRLISHIELEPVFNSFESDLVKAIETTDHDIINTATKKYGEFASAIVHTAVVNAASRIIIPQELREYKVLSAYTIGRSCYLRPYFTEEEISKLNQKYDVIRKSLTKR